MRNPINDHEMSGLEVTGYSSLAIGVIAGSIGVAAYIHEQSAPHDVAQPAATIEMAPPAAPDNLIVTIPPTEAAPLNLDQQYDLAYHMLTDGYNAPHNQPIAVPETITDAALRGSVLHAASLRRADNISRGSNTATATTATAAELATIPEEKVRQEATQATALGIYANLRRELIDNPDALAKTDDDEALQAVLANNAKQLTDMNAKLAAAQTTSQQAHDLLDQNDYDGYDAKHSGLLEEWSDANGAALAAWGDIYDQETATTDPILDKSPAYHADQAASAKAQDEYEHACDAMGPAEQQDCYADRAVAAIKAGDQTNDEKWASHVTDPAAGARIDAAEADQAIGFAKIGSSSLFEDWSAKVADPQQRLRVEDAATDAGVSSLKYGATSVAEDWFGKVHNPDDMAKIDSAYAAAAASAYDLGYRSLGDDYLYKITDPRVMSAVLSAHPN